MPALTQIKQCHAHYRRLVLSTTGNRDLGLSSFAVRATQSLASRSAELPTIYTRDTAPSTSAAARLSGAGSLAECRDIAPLARSRTERPRLKGLPDFKGLAGHRQRAGRGINLFGTILSKNILGHLVEMVLASTNNQRPSPQLVLFGCPGRIRLLKWDGHSILHVLAHGRKVECDRPWPWERAPKMQVHTKQGARFPMQGHLQIHIDTNLSQCATAGQS